jgi:trafficking protein particle complex subunit 3
MARQQRPGEASLNQSERINIELLSFTYGALVVRLLKDQESISKVNQLLEQMGYNIGVRLIDDFLSKNDVNCEDIRDTADAIAKIGFKVYLGITCDVANWSDDSKEFSLILTENPIIDFVELREEHRDLNYCSLICGVIRGALYMLRFEAKAEIVKDRLKGDEVTEIRCSIISRKADEYVPDDEA